LKHVEDSNKHITEEIVHQVCHLPELYEDARSERYIKKISCTAVYAFCTISRWGLCFRILEHFKDRILQLFQLSNGEQIFILWNAVTWLQLNWPNKTR